MKTTMKPAIALSLLSAAASQEYAPITKLRGVSPQTIKLQNARDQTVRLDPATKLELALRSVHVKVVGDDAASLAACASHPQEECSDSCTWCVSKAVSSACYPSGMAGRLPAGVFECEQTEQVAKEAEEVAEEELRSEFFHLKQGITLTMSSGAVDKEFCDPNSGVSLAGYMNGEQKSVFVGGGEHAQVLVGLIIISILLNYSHINIDFSIFSQGKPI
jgi:hypothetical protein